MRTVADHCDLTVHNGAPAVHLRGEGLDVVYPLTPSEAATFIKRLAGSLAQIHVPAGDRTSESLAHPDNDVLRDIHEEPAA